MIETDLLGFVVTMQLGFSEQYAKSLGLAASGFNFLFCTHPSAMWQQTTPKRC